MNIMCFLGYSFHSFVTECPEGEEADGLLHITPTHLKCLSWSLVSPSPTSLWNTVVSLSSTLSRESDSAVWRKGDSMIRTMSEQLA